MERDNQRRNSIITCLLSGVISASFLMSGILSVLFLVPLQAVASRKGIKSLLAASGVVFAVLCVDAVIGVKTWDQASLAIVAVELGVPLAFMVLLVLMDLSALSRIRVLVRVLIGTLAATALTVPFILYAAGNQGVMDGIRDQIKTVVGAFFPSGGQAENFEQSVLKAQLTPEGLFSLVSSVYLKSFAFMYYLLFSLTYWLGKRFGQIRVPGEQPGGLRRFSVPPYAIWLFIVPWAVVAASLLLPIGTIVEAVAWNVGLIVAFIYGLQGVGIVQSLFVRFAVSPVLRTVIVAVLVILAITPVVDLAIAIAFPCLGISELWVRYRNYSKGAD
jgi:hypothetical protein